MKVFEAKEITGGLSKPSKMPGFSYNLPAYKCITGVKLQAVPGSVCAGCYAMKGRYAFSNTKKAMNRRLASLTHPKWGLAMSVQINSKFKNRYCTNFRKSANKLRCFWYYALIKLKFIIWEKPK